MNKVMLTKIVSLIGAGAIVLSNSVACTCLNVQKDESLEQKSYEYVLRDADSFGAIWILHITLIQKHLPN